MILPSNSDRLCIIGQTGTGKTVAAAWHLSKRNFDEMPWIIFDFKGDKLIAKMRAREISITGPVPSEPGLYVVRPFPNQKEAVQDFLMRVWAHENVGLWIDEGYMIEAPAFDTILTQGRSKNIPVIVLSQRPVWMSRFVFTESQFFQVFHLNDKNDRKRIQDFIPANLASRLPRYHSYYYNVGDDALDSLAPVPRESVILAAIAAKVKSRRKFL